MADQQGGMGKMLITLPLLMLVGRMDFSDEMLLNTVRLCYFASVAVNAGVHYLILQKIKERRSGDSRKIWVKGTPPMQGQIVETTYMEHESAMAKQALQQALMGAAIMSLLHFKMGLHAPLVLQIVMVPYNLWTSTLFKLYIMSEAIEKPWKESFEPPSAAEQAAAAGGAAAASDVEAKTQFESAVVAAWEDQSKEQTLDAPVALLRREAVPVDHQVSEDKWTILMVAAGHKRVPAEVLGNILSAYNPDLFLQDSDGWTALHWACHHNRGEAVTKLLLAALDSDLDAAGTGDDSMVDVSQLYRLSPRVRSLLEVRDGGDQTALDIAIAENSVQALEALGECGVKLPEGALDAARKAAAAASVESVAGAAEDTVGAATSGLAQRKPEASDISEVD